jgi:hypothetical protein
VSFAEYPPALGAEGRDQKARVPINETRDENSATLCDRFTGKVIADMPTGIEPHGAAFDARTGTAFGLNGGLAGGKFRPKRRCAAAPAPVCRIPAALFLDIDL